MSKGPEKIEETEQQKVLAKIMGEEWDLYQKDIVPIENKIIEDAQSSNGEDTYNEVGKNSNLATQTNSSLSELSGNMIASGVDPSSGKFQDNIDSLSEIEATNRAKVQSNAEQNAQETYTTKLGNVVAIGNDQATQSVATTNDIARNSQQEAQLDNQISNKQRDDALGAFGAIAGAATSRFTSNSNSVPNVDENLNATGG